MLVMTLALVMALTQAQPTQPNAANTPLTTIGAPAVPNGPSITPPPVAAAADEDADLAAKLLHVRRIYVESFGDDTISKQVNAMVINSLSHAKRFVVTENKEKADAVLKGTALEKTSQEFHASSEGTGVAGAAGGHHSTVGGTFVDGTGTVSGSSSGGFAARAARIDDSVASTETINDARVAVRLVSKDGDVIWTSTQESTGAKYKGASADVADKITKQLLRDLEKLEKKSGINGQE